MSPAALNLSNYRVTIETEFSFELWSCSTARLLDASEKWSNSLLFFLFFIFMENIIKTNSSVCNHSLMQPLTEEAQKMRVWYKISKVSSRDFCVKGELVRPMHVKKYIHIYKRHQSLIPDTSRCKEYKNIVQFSKKNISKSRRSSKFERTLQWLIVNGKKCWNSSGLSECIETICKVEHVLIVIGRQYTRLDRALNASLCSHHFVLTLDLRQRKTSVEVGDGSRRKAFS